MTKKTIALMAMAASLSLGSKARAQSEEAPPEPAAAPEPATKPPPETGEAATPPAKANDLVLCPPFTNQGRTDRDHAPGRGAQIGGGMLIFFGLANLAVGAGIAAWGAEEGNLNKTAISAAFAGAGGAAFIAGIPVVVAGNRKARRARVEHAELNLAPLPSGGTARVRLAF